MPNRKSRAGLKGVEFKGGMVIIIMWKVSRGSRAFHFNKICPCNQS